MVNGHRPDAGAAKEKSGQPRRFGKLLKDIREFWGLSQTEIAVLLNCDHSYISRLETGEREPSYEMVDDITDIFELKPDQRDALLVGAGFPEENVVTISRTREPELAEAVEIIQSGALSLEDENAARELLKIIIEIGRAAMNDSHRN